MCIQVLLHELLLLSQREQNLSMGLNVNHLFKGVCIVIMQPPTRHTIFFVDHHYRYCCGSYEYGTTQYMD